MNNQEQYSLFELELFKCPFSKSYVRNGKFDKIYPITKLEDSRLITFLMNNATDHFLDLKQSYRNIKFKLANSDGSNLAVDAKSEFG